MSSELVSEEHMNRDRVKRVRDKSLLFNRYRCRLEKMLMDVLFVCMVLVPIIMSLSWMYSQRVSFDFYLQLRRSQV